MTTTEFILSAIIYLLIGCLICVKRKWYSYLNPSHNWPNELCCAATICFMPIALIVAIIREFIIRDWNNT